MFGNNNYGGGFTQQGGASYRPQQAQQQPAETLSLDDVMQGGAPSAFSKDDPIGTTCRPHCKTQIASETPAFVACT